MRYRKTPKNQSNGNGNRQDVAREKKSNGRHQKWRSQNGYALTMVTFFAVMGSIIAGSYMAFSVSDMKHAQHEVDSTEALYLAESGLQRALFEIRSIFHDPNLSLPTGAHPIANYNLDTVSAPSQNYSGQTNIDILITPQIANIAYNVSSSAVVRTARKTLYGVIRYHPPAGVFDYVYFINNWGRFLDNSIRANGDVRSNGRFDFAGNPTVNGEVYAAGGIDTSGGAIRGTAGTQGPNGDYPSLHSGSSRLHMPNIQDLSIYENRALASGSLSIGGTLVVNGVYGDEAGESGNLVLIGTVQNPIRIQGPVVVRGDVVIKGIIEGQGTLYTGRNLYVADNINYKQGPTQARPASNSDSDRDAWYAAHMDKDLVAFAARENIIVGDYTANNWGADTYLFTMGDEDVGYDSVPGTSDMYEGDNAFQPEYEDLDEDGVRDTAYTWSSVQTNVPITSFDNVPGNVTNFANVATTRINSLDGIYYTNHAFAGSLSAGASINGALVAKDEALVHSGSLNFNYDERIHSRYTQGNAQWLINFGLPMDGDWGLEQWQE